MSSRFSFPVIDLAPFLDGETGHAAEDGARQIEAACRDTGFFYLSGHGVSATTIKRLDAQARAFFALPQVTKEEIAMSRGGRAWRGYFPVGGELTSGKPDRKEGIYFGVDINDTDPRVRARLPLHGRNLYPEGLPELREAVDDFMREATRAGHALARGVAMSLGLAPNHFAAHYTSDPTILFRVFHYPPGEGDEWGVGEHTDYGFLTLLAQDSCGGLQVKTPGGWTDAPPIEGTLICNIGDMLDRMTGGRYRSTPHRVLNTSGMERISFPLFFDPSWSAVVGPLPGFENPANRAAEARWDGQDVHGFSGTYGDYLLGKVGKVFPDLVATALED